MAQAPVGPSSDDLPVPNASQSATDNTSLASQAGPADPAAGVLPFVGLRAPEPLDADPPAVARWLAFAGTLIGAILGGMIGYGTADLMGFPGWAVALAGVLFAVGGAVGVGVIAQLTLRAMNEWNAVSHPEDERR